MKPIYGKEVAGVTMRARDATVSLSGVNAVLLDMHRGVGTLRIDDTDVAQNIVAATIHIRAGEQMDITLEVAGECIAGIYDAVGEKR